MPRLLRPTAAAPAAIRGLRLRRGVAVAGTGLMFTLSAFALAACGSDPSNASVDPAPQSSTSGVQKKAGEPAQRVLDTRLTVINESGQSRPVKVCNPNSWDARDAPTDCPFFNGDLLDGQEAVGQHGAQGIWAEVHYADGSITYIEADNPQVGEPYFFLSTSPGGAGENTGKVYLDAGEVKWPVQIRDHYYQLERRGDNSGYKEMRLIIK